MNTTMAWVLNAVLLGGLLLGTTLLERSWMKGAAHRLESGEALETGPTRAPLLASAAEHAYCTDQLKTVLRRVLTNCGLIGGGRRGCQPGELRNVAQINDQDFNALFKPLDKRGGVILFDQGKDGLDEASKKLVEDHWANQQGASYFFIVGRASTDGTVQQNRALSHRRVNSVLFHIQERYKATDPDIEQKVGLMWLGEEYAQLGTEFCLWENSRTGQPCDEEKINRSVIISWIDCRL